MVATGWHNVSYFAAPGDTDLLGYVDAALVNSASTALTLDVTFVGVVCQVFMVVEGRRVGLAWSWLVGLLVGTAAVAVAVIPQLSVGAPASARTGLSALIHCCPHGWQSCRLIDRARST